MARRRVSRPILYIMAESNHSSFGNEGETNAAPKTATGGGGAPGGRNRLLGIVVFVLAFALVIGGVAVVRQAMRATAAGTAAGAPGADAGGGGSAVPVAKRLDDARGAMSRQEFAHAEVILTKAAEAYPEDQGVRLQLAQNLVAQQKFKEAYAQYEAAIALSPRPAPGEMGGVGDPKLHFEAGTVANQAGYVERAEEHYSMAQAGDPSEARYPLYLAMVQIKLGKDGPALASLIRATKLNPELAIGWGTLAELALRENQLGLAMQHVEKARLLEPREARWRVVEARALKRRAEAGDVEKALQLLLSLEQSDRMTPEVLKAMGECYGLLQRPADAAYVYSEAAKLRPQDADIAYETALWYQRAGNEKEAVRFGKIAQELMDRRAVVGEGK